MSRSRWMELFDVSCVVIFVFEKPAYIVHLRNSIHKNGTTPYHFVANHHAQLPMKTMTYI